MKKAEEDTKNWRIETKRIVSAAGQVIVGINMWMTVPIVIDQIEGKLFQMESLVMNCMCLVMNSDQITDYDNENQKVVESLIEMWMKEIRMLIIINSIIITIVIIVIIIICVKFEMILLVKC